MSELASASSASALYTKRRVKICGVTRKEQALAIAALGADHLGLNFWPQSKRHLLPEAAAGWAAEMPRTVGLTGVFVNQDPTFIRETAAAVGLASIQLHGDETPRFCAELSSEGYHVVKAFQVRDEASLEAIADYPVADILLDAYHPGQRGGIGQTFPWALALAFKRKYPDRALWLAGGLTPENVASAAHAVRPYAVDVAGGVEDDQPGVKNLDKVRRFIENARAAAPII